MGAPSQTPVLILTGPPGAGKTTAARVLAERSERAVHLESDSFFHFIRSGYVEPWRPESREQNEVVMRIVAGAAAAYAAAGYFTIIDGIVLPRFFFEPLLADPEVVERLWHDFADLGALERHALDVDAEGPGAAAGLLDARLQAGSLDA